MRNWIALLLLIPMWLLTISGTAEAPNRDATVPTENVTLATTEPTIETIVQESTEATSGEDIDSDEWFVADDPNYVAPSNKPPKVTEPPATEPEKQEPELGDNLHSGAPETEQISLGIFKLTAYCNCEECCGIWAGGPTASGTAPLANRTIAVDTRVIPFGTTVLINGCTYVAEDVGSSIKGACIDIYFNSHAETVEFGIQYAEVFICG